MNHKTHYHWTRGNAKLNKTAKKVGAKVVGFSMLAGKDCPYAGRDAGGCYSICYARQGRFVIGDAARVRESQSAAVRRDVRSGAFESRLVSDLTAIAQSSRKRVIVRIHDSGDFYSRAYLGAWCRALARVAPLGVEAYAYTKSLGFIDWSAVPDNLTLIQSVGGKLDAQIDASRPHARIFATHAEMTAAGYVDGTETDLPAMEGRSRIGLVYHGSTRLTRQKADGLRSRRLAVVA